MINPSPRFTGIFIPAEILEIEGLTLLETMLLAWIDALYCKEHKGCYASNEYLAQRLKNVKVNTVVKALTKLRKLGLVEDVSFNGRQRIIRACLHKAIYEGQSQSACDQPSESQAACDLNHMQGMTKITGSMCLKSQSSHSSPYIEIKDDIKEERGRGEPLKPPHTSDSEKKIERAPNVATSEKEHEVLVKKFGIRVNACYKRLSEHKEDTPKAKWKKNDSRSIQRWVIDAVKEEELKEKKRGDVEMKGDEVEEEAYNRNWIKQVQARYHGKIPNETITDTFDYVQFRNDKTNRDSDKIYFKDTRFKELVKHEINKRKIP